MNDSIEFQVLRAVCLATVQGSLKEIAGDILREYHWHNALHQALWEALGAIPTENPEIFRQLLPAQMTRAGFPDVEWEVFFAPHTLSKEKAIALMRRMVKDG